MQSHAVEPFTLQERLYTPQEVAERLGVSERWVRDHATRRNPRIRVVKLGPLLRFREADIAAFISAQMTHLPSGSRGNL
jgi:excisionase family DNA binding protein